METLLDRRMGSTGRYLWEERVREGTIFLSRYGVLYMDGFTLFDKRGKVTLASRSSLRPGFPKES